MKHTILILVITGILCVPLTSTRAQTTTANTALIQQLLAQIVILQAELAKLIEARGGNTTPCTFTRTLREGTQGTDVTCLQTYLKKKGHLQGTATGFYGPQTKDAVYKWQQSAGIVPEPTAIGMFGPRSQEMFMVENKSEIHVPATPMIDSTREREISNTDVTDRDSKGKKPVITRTEFLGTVGSAGAVTLMVLTDKVATCRFDTESGTYTALGNVFDEGNTRRHSVRITSAPKDVEQRFYVRCMSDEGVVSSETKISLTVKGEVVSAPLSPTPTPTLPPKPTQIFTEALPRPGNETACVNAGWQKITTTIDGRERHLMYKGPQDAWKGSIIVMHGGGGDYTQWCYNSAPAIKPQVDFSDLAVSRGFGVFLLDSTNDVVTDANGRVCGKRFDATVVDGRSTNVDLPFIERVITDIIPLKRVSGSSPSIFITGESTGGYMTTRAATHFDNLVTAFAPAASGDPYGTYFDCNPALSPRDSAKGAGFDRETNIQIILPNSCVSASYPNEKPWETTSPSKKPAFKTFHHTDDGVADLSCREKVATQLRVHGYPDDGAYVIPSSGARSIWAHFWQGAYNVPILDFFERNLK